MSKNTAKLEVIADIPGGESAGTKVDIEVSKTGRPREYKWRECIRSGFAKLVEAPAKANKKKEDK